MTSLFSSPAKTLLMRFSPFTPLTFVSPTLLTPFMSTLSEPLSLVLTKLFAASFAVLGSVFHRLSTVLRGMLPCITAVLPCGFRTFLIILQAFPKPFTRLIQRTFAGRSSPFGSVLHRILHGILHGFTPSFSHSSTLLSGLSAETFSHFLAPFFLSWFPILTHMATRFLLHAFSVLTPTLLEFFAAAAVLGSVFHRFSTVLRAMLLSFSAGFPRPLEAPLAPLTKFFSGPLSPLPRLLPGLLLRFEAALSPRTFRARARLAEASWRTADAFSVARFAGASPLRGHLLSPLLCVASDCSKSTGHKEHW